MRKLQLVALFILPIALAPTFAFDEGNNHFSFKIEGEYLKFRNHSNKEFKNKIETKIEGQIQHGNIYIKAGDAYKSFRKNPLNLNATITHSPLDLRKRSVNTHILYLKAGAKLNKAEISVGGMLSAGSGAIPRLRAINTELKTRKFIVFSPVASIDLGLFGQYAKLKRNGSDYKADVVQLTPSLYITYQRVYGKLFVNFENINSNYKDHDKDFVSGGFDAVAYLSDKLGITTGVKIGKSLYLSDGENFDILPRKQKLSYYLGTLINVSKQVSLKLSGNYERYEVIDVKESQKAQKLKKASQGGFGINAGIDVKF